MTATNEKFHCLAPERRLHAALRDIHPTPTRREASRTKASLARRQALRLHAYLTYGTPTWLVRRPCVTSDGRPTAEVFFWVTRLRRDVVPDTRLGELLNQLDWMRANGLLHDIEFREAAYIRNHNSEWGPVSKRLIARAVLEPPATWGLQAGEVEINLAREAGLSWAVPPDAVPSAWGRVATKEQLQTTGTGVEIGGAGIRHKPYTGR